MSTVFETTELVGRLRGHLAERPAPLHAFLRHGAQVEGWFKGEMLCFLEGERAAGRIANVEREAIAPGPRSRRRIDYRVAFRSNGSVVTAWLELDHWLVGRHRQQTFEARSRLQDTGAGGVRHAVERLLEIRGGDKYVLALMTGNPGARDWEAGVGRFNEKFRPLAIEALTRPEDYPQEFFLGLIKAIRR